MRREVKRVRNLSFYSLNSCWHRYLVETFNLHPVFLETKSPKWISFCVCLHLSSALIKCEYVCLSSSNKWCMCKFREIISIHHTRYCTIRHAIWWIIFKKNNNCYPKQAIQSTGKFKRNLTCTISLFLYYCCDGFVWNVSMVWNYIWQLAFI